jgi:hypothetical protein
MPKHSKALKTMPPSTQAALEQLGAHLAVARLRRGESLRVWAKRLGVSVPTLLRLEGGDPSVSAGVLATALWLIGRDGALAEIASPSSDLAALDMDVRQATELGRKRARASAEGRLQRQIRASRGEV